MSRDMSIYDKYYKKGGTYELPIEVFNELIDKLDSLDMEDVSDKYKDMIDSFECDFNVALDDSFGITWFSQMLKRIRNNEKLTKKDEQFLKDLDLLSELSFNLRHGLLYIVSKDVDKQ